MEAGNIDSVEELAKLTNKLSPKLRDEVMTLADRLKYEGEAKATREVATRMLSKGSEPNFVSEVTGLSVEIFRSLPMTKVKGIK